MERRETNRAEDTASRNRITKLSRREKRKERRMKTSRQKIKQNEKVDSKADGSTCANDDVWNST